VGHHRLPAGQEGGQRGQKLLHVGDGPGDEHCQEQQPLGGFLALIFFVWILFIYFYNFI
jgi:hypothetical protein